MCLIFRNNQPFGAISAILFIYLLTFLFCFDTHWPTNRRERPTARTSPSSRSLRLRQQQHQRTNRLANGERRGQHTEQKTATLDSRDGQFQYAVNRYTLLMRSTTKKDTRGRKKSHRRVHHDGGHQHTTPTQHLTLRYTPPAGLFFLYFFFHLQEYFYTHLAAPKKFAHSFFFSV
jgi:hypothetical protein